MYKRQCSPYGTRAASQLGYELARQGGLVISGLAKGIDGAAHQGALRAGGFTAAVLGGGADVIYPPENRRLYEDIAATGVLLSEYPPGTEPRGGHFPVRNRIISGLSLAVVVVEAPEKSGALITANTALEQGRDVFAVPGPIHAASSRGCHQLLRDGAGLAMEAWDVLGTYQQRFPQKLRPIRAVLPETPGSAEAEPAPASVSYTHLDVYKRQGPDCAARQQVTYEAPGLGPWPVTEQLLAALTAAGQWEPSEIHVVSVTSRA